MAKLRTSISIEEARNIALFAQLCKGSRALKNISTNSERIIDHLGYVQIDTISVVERAHNHIFWSRDHRFTPEVLDNLLASGKLFEYWTHAMSYIPMSDYRYYLPKMRNFQAARHPWFKEKENRSKQIQQYVLDRIKAEGPLGSKDFENTRNNKSTGWWDWKPAKDALEILFWKGELMIQSRNKFQKLYDIPERVIPADIPTDIPSPEDVALFIVNRAAKSLGIFSRKDLHRYLQPEGKRESDLRACSPEALDAAMRQQINTAELLPMRIEGIAAGEYYVPPAHLTSKVLHPSEKTVQILSPFDNVVIKRDRLKNLFAFDYTIECYVPQPKRKFGYFVLPVLFGNEFFARIDVKADRKNKELIILNLIIENDEWKSNGFIESFATSLINFAAFNQCKGIRIQQTNNEKAGKEIVKQLKVKIA